MTILCFNLSKYQLSGIFTEKYYYRLSNPIGNIHVLSSLDIVQKFFLNVSVRLHGTTLQSVKVVYYIMIYEIPAFSLCQAPIPVWWDKTWSIIWIRRTLVILKFFQFLSYLLNHISAQISFQKY